ncbi:MAG TPA: hypothetical protein VMV98_06545 [Acidobacteriaceae bacterium]|jgi:hypothetical protein|nr:hypothetical protein [Acidobacteriaceae bacterium]
MAAYTWEQILEAYHKGIDLGIEQERRRAQKEQADSVQQLKAKIANWFARKYAAEEDGSGHTPDPSLEELRRLSAE